MQTMTESNKALTQATQGRVTTTTKPIFNHGQTEQSGQSQQTLDGFEAAASKNNAQPQSISPHPLTPKNTEAGGVQVSKKDACADPKSFKPTTGYKIPEKCELFADTRPQAKDVKQGSLANCYFISTLAALAEKRPHFIKSMISDQGDGKYAIRFYHEGKPKWIMVDADLPQKLNERGPLYAKTSDSDKDGRPEIWAPLIEKAFAKFREQYPLPGKENRKGYHCLHYGRAHQTYEALTGLKGQRIELVDSLDKTLPTTINDFLRPDRQDDLWSYACGSNRGCIVVAGTGNLSENDKKKACAGLVGKHVYTVLKTYTRNGERFIQLRNPWGSGEPRQNHDGTDDGVFVMRWNDFMQTFKHLSGAAR